VIAVTPLAITGIVARSPGPAGTTQVLLRAHALSPDAAGRSGVLAWEMLLAVDCGKGQVRMGATSGFAGRQPDAASFILAPADTEWRRPREQTTLQNAWRAVCDPGFQPPLRASAQTAQAAPKTTPAVTRASTPAAPAAAATAYRRDASAQASAAPASDRPGRAAAQVVSSPVEADSRTALARLRGRYARAFDGLDTRVQPAQVRGRTVYRGLVVGFASQAQAQAFCQTLKRGGQDCLAR
jgi:hypothetical protein